MPKSLSSALPGVLKALAVILIAKITLSVVVEYRNYLPPNFESDFLRGRQSYFWGPYHWAFFAHLVAGPAALILGAILLSERFRQSAAVWHRRLGRLHVACVVLLLTPSGLWMACYAATGAIAAAGLGSLAIATAACVVLGTRAAISRQIADHRRWMQRAFVLLCSAIVIRMIGGLATVAQYDAAWLYPFSTWASWVVPLLAFESLQLLELRDPPRERVAASG